MDVKDGRVKGGLQRSTPGAKRGGWGGNLTK